MDSKPVEASSPKNTVDYENLEEKSIPKHSDSEDIVKNHEDSEEVAKHEAPEVIGSQNIAQSTELHGYLHSGDNIEDATILLGPLNLSSQNLMTQNDDANEIIVFVPGDNETQTDTNFTHNVFQSQAVASEGEEHGTSVVGEHSQSLKFIENAEEEQKERHGFIENSGQILNISNENIGSPIPIESPLQTVSKSQCLKNDGTEMVFIPNPTVVLAPEEMKHRKLMQLACIAHELESADPKSSSIVVCDSEASTSADKNPPVEALQNDDEEEKNPHIEKASSPKEREECINFSSDKNELINNDSPMIFTDKNHVEAHPLNTDGEVSHTKTDEAKSIEDEDPDSDDSDSSFSLTECDLSKELDMSVRTPEDNTQNETRSLHSSDIEMIDDTCCTHSAFVPENESPFLNSTFNYKQKSSTKPDETNSIVEDEDPDSHDSDSSFSLPECDLSKELDMSVRTPEDNAQNETRSLHSSDIEMIDETCSTHSAFVPENESPFLNRMFNYKQKSSSPVLPVQLQNNNKSNDQQLVDLNETNPNEINDLNKIQIDKTKSDNEKVEVVDFKQLPTENLESDLVIAEGGESISDVASEMEDRKSNLDKTEPTTKRDSECKEENFKPQSPEAVRRSSMEELICTGIRPDCQQELSPVLDVETSDSKESNNVSVEKCLRNEVQPVKKNVKRQRIRSPREEEDDDDSSCEESPLKSMTKKTYMVKKKMKRSLFESKNNQEESS